MFTPQKKGWPGWALSPSKTDPSGKGKAVAEAVPLPRVSPDENGLAERTFATPGEVSVWKRFKDSGLLDQGSVERKERESLLDRVSKLEEELYDYQYNMGLLLIEKKEWLSKYEELKEALREANENLKREQAAHLIALSEAQKREEACRKALGVEKQCVSDVEKSLHDLRSESAEIKFISDKKLAEAHALMASVEERSLEAEAKIHSAEARLAEANRKYSEAERKIQEVEGRENSLKKERASLKAEREAHEEVFVRERENLRDWDKKLQENQERLVEGQRLLNQRDERANEKDKVLKQKEKEIDEMRKTIEADLIALKDKEVDISLRLSALTGQEEEFNVKRRDLEAKEKALLELQGALDIRDSEGIQKIVEEHNSILELRKNEYEVELEQKRKSFEEDLKAKELAVDARAVEAEKKEVIFMKKEQMLEKREEKFKERQKDLDLKLKELKEREKSLKKEEKDVLAEKKLVSSEKDLLRNAKIELEKLQASVEAEKLQILQERENLQVKEGERREFQHQQSELKQMIEDNLLKKQLLIEQTEELRKEKEHFEKEWLSLDEKREDLVKEEEHVNGEKERLKKWVDDEGARLKHDNQVAMEGIQREKEALGLQKEAFENSMQYERSQLHEKSLREIEDKRCALELEIRERQHQMNSDFELRENKFQEEIRVFQDYKEKTLRDIAVEKDLIQKQMEESQKDEQKLQVEMEELKSRRHELEGQRLEIQKDTDQLLVLSRKLKDQRETFRKEREHFFCRVEQLKRCVGEDVITDELDRSTLQMQNFDDIGTSFLPSLLDGYLKESSNHESSRKIEKFSPGKPGDDSNTPNQMSWIRKCTRKIFSFSPNKRTETSPENLCGKSPLQIDHQPGSTVRNGDVAADSHGALPLDSYIGLEEEPTLSLDGQTYRDTAAEALSDSLNMENSHSLVSSSNMAKAGRKGKKKGFHRSRSVEATVDEARVYLGEASRANADDSSLDNGKTSIKNIQEHKEDFLDRDKATGHGQNQQSTVSSFMMSDADDSEVRSDSVSGRGRKRKPTNMAADGEAPTTKRYNLRRSTVATKDSAKASAVRETHAGEKHNVAELEKSIKIDRMQNEASDPPSLKAPQGELQVRASGHNPHHLEQQPGSKVHQFSQTILRVETEIGVARNFNAEMVRIDNPDDIGQENHRDEVEGGYEGLDYSEDAYEEDNDDKEEDNVGNRSIGKKLWTFLTT